MEFGNNLFDEYIDASSEEIESDTETVQSDGINLIDVHNDSEDDDPYMEKYLCDNHFSVENVDERVSQLERYKVQIKLLKILNDEDICPKNFNLVMNWVNEIFYVKPHVRPPQKIRK